MRLPFQKSQPRLTQLAGRVLTSKLFPDDRALCTPLGDAVRRDRDFHVSRRMFIIDAASRWVIRNALLR